MSNHPFRFFGDHAIAFLGYMYKDNEDRCRQLLVTNNTSVRTTVLNMAVKCENLGFVAHRASQAVVENVWRGKIACDASNLKVNLNTSTLNYPLLLTAYNGDISNIF